MKKIPASIELDEDDIREAIEYWLNNEHNEDYDRAYIITFKVTEVQSDPPGGHRGGMSDPIITQVISALAEEDE
jgi:hypothetical protein